MAKIHVTTTINGTETEFLARPEQTLLSALRDELGMMGTKEGCGSGDCGACSIEVNGRVTCACLMLAAEASGKDITTVEGIAAGRSISLDLRRCVSMSRDLALSPVPSRA